MEQTDYIEMGLNGDAPLKVIMCGSVETNSNDNIGVVSLVYATTDREMAKERIYDLMEKDPESYYMVYSVPLDTDLTRLGHYPSICITKEDLKSKTPRE